MSHGTLEAGHAWLTQHKIEAHYDVTVVYVYGRVFAFSLDRQLFDGLDWRKSVFDMARRWEPYSLPESAVAGIRSFMNELQWSFGRLDFLLTDNGLVFLEVNPNGQWAWLDADQSNGLFAAMKDCIDPDLPLPKGPQV